MKEFLLSDESMNSHGCVVLTAGIRMERFLKNPIMLYMHNRELGIAGRWDNVRVDGKQLYGTPVFDTHHEPGKSTKEKVENGFLKGASIGIDNCILETIDGVQTVTSCELQEVSICDIPSNENALQLYYNNNPVDLPTYLKLSLKEQGTMNEQDFKSLLQALGLPGQSSIQDVLKAVDALKRTSQAENSVKLTLSSAYKEGVISKAEQMDLGDLFGDDTLKLAKYLEIRRKDRQCQLERGFDDFVKSHLDKFKTYSYDFINGEMKKFALKDFSTFTKMMEKAPKLLLPMDLIRSGHHDSNSMKLKSDWTLEDYRKNAPQELQRNPALYQELLEKENKKQ